MTERKRFRLFDSKILWAVVSLLASLLIWIYMTSTQQESITSELRNVELVIEGQEAIQKNYDLLVSNVSASTVNVVISGTRLNIGGLSAKDVQAVIDVSRIQANGEGNYSRTFTLRYPEGVNADAVTLVSSNPSQVSFVISRLATRTFPVQSAFVGSAAEGYILDDLECNPATVTISGLQSDLDKIDHVYAELGGEDMQINRTRTADVQFVLKDAEGNDLEIEGLEFSSDTVELKQNILMRKEVPLELSLIHGAGANDTNTRVSIEPSSIIIAGDPSIVEGYNKVVLGPVDLTDFGLTYESDLNIVLDNEILNVTGVTKATVKLELSGLAVKYIDVTNLSFTGLPEGYASAEILSRSLSVLIRAPMSVMEDIVAENIRAVADLSGVTAVGDQSVPVRIFVDGFTDAGAVDDYAVIVRITK